MTNEILTAALQWAEAGCSVIPIRADGTKRPAVEWKRYQQERASSEQISQWFTAHPEWGIGIVCGAVSGNLEMLELEGRAMEGDKLNLLDAELSVTHQAANWELIRAGYQEWTPSGGIHLLYRLSDIPVPGNTKLANTPDIDPINSKPIALCMAETRGEGGYVIVAPSGGTVHASGEDWQIISGSPAQIISIDSEVQRRVHKAVALALNTMPPPIAPMIEHRPPIIIPMPDLGGERPGDEFNRKVSWMEILGRAGWTISHQQTNGEIFWVRPGKSTSEGHSASTRTDGCLYVWSTSAGLPTEVPLSKFFVYAHYNHGGDLKAAAAFLRRQGLGEDRPLPARDDSFFADYEGPAAEPIGPVELPDVNYKIRMRPWDDIGNAQRLTDRYGWKLRWVEDAGCWAVYEHGRWQLDRSRMVDQLAVKMFDNLYEEEKNFYANEAEEGSRSKLSQRDQFRAYVTKQRVVAKVSACIRLAGALAGMQAAITDFDKHPMLLNCKNVIVDLRTGETLEHDPKLYLMQQAGVDYNSTIHAPRWDKFLSQVMPDLQMADYLQMITGYSITGKINEQAMFIHNGVGANGKSVYLKVMTKILADYGQTVPRSTLLVKASESHPTEIARMIGKRFLQTSETAPGRRLDEEVVKQLTGGENATARFMNKDFFDFEPTGKIHYVTNHLPRMTNAPSIWRRTHLIMWDVVVPEEDQDKDLAEHIFDEEAAGVLAWMVAGAIAWYQQGLKRPEKAKGDLAEYRNDEDTLGGFIEQELIIDDDIETTVFSPMVDIYRSYQRWANTGGVKFPMTMNDLSAALRERDFRRHRRSTTRGFKGISVRPPIAHTSIDWT